MSTLHWTTISQPISPSRSDALEFIRERLPATCRAWVSFEFQTDTGPVGVDALILTEQAFILIEIKDWSGAVQGDDMGWSVTSPDGEKFSVENPVEVAVRKARSLSSTLRNKYPELTPRIPWLESIVFISSDAVQCDITGSAAEQVTFRDNSLDEGQARKGIVSWLTAKRGRNGDQQLGASIDRDVIQAIELALNRLALRPRNYEAEDIVEAAESWVIAKLAAGWTRDDFLRGLGNILGCRDNANDAEAKGGPS